MLYETKYVITGCSRTSYVPTKNALTKSRINAANNRQINNGPGQEKIGPFTLSEII
jgi:regulator of PEP synthase PpsR (kinase-PPPase family)